MVALLAASAGEGAAVEQHATPQLFALGLAQLRQHLLHGVIHLPMQRQQHRLTFGCEAGLLAAAIGGVGMPADKVALGQASQRAAGIGFVDAQFLGQLLVGGWCALQLDQQVCFDGSECQLATVLGEHAKFTNQIARQGAQGTGIHVGISCLVVPDN